MTYPLHLQLQGKRVLVVGAGKVAARRVDRLLNEHADVVVVAPEAEPRIRQLNEDGLITWRQRSFDFSDVIGAWLVHVATDCPEINALAAQEAHRRGIWSIRADDADATDAVTPAVSGHGNVVVSVSSCNPRESTRISRTIQDYLIDGTLRAATRSRQRRGSVVLIGGGPGDPDLLTIRGRRALLSADVVIVDRLAPRALLDELDPEVEVIEAGKRPDDHEMTQQEINAAIVRHALRGSRVARLKGGDPFVFGRGSEEVQACLEAGIPVEVVPGISSSLSAPLAAGIPVTHRGVSSGFMVVSGHDLEDVSSVASHDLTTIILMGMARLEAIAMAFIAHGRAESTPVAIIHRAYGPDQCTIRGTLADIHSRVASAGIGNPAVIVIGDVVDVLAHVDGMGLAS